jgi:hypothetical protein
MYFMFSPSMINFLAGAVTGYGLDGRGLILGREKGFSLLHGFHTGSEARPTSYEMCTLANFPEGKVAGA